MTDNGKQCISWDSDAYKNDDITAEKYLGYDLAENFCRNPDGIWKTIGCYTDEKVGLKSWDSCTAKVNDNMNNMKTESGLDYDRYIFKRNIIPIGKIRFR